MKTRVSFSLIFLFVFLLTPAGDFRHVFARDLQGSVQVHGGYDLDELAAWRTWHDVLSCLRVCVNHWDG